jgi:prevent-host-death family protein
MTRTVGATDLRQRLTDILQAVREHREAYVVETFGRPQAVLVNLDEYERMQRLQRGPESSKSDRQAVDVKTIQESRALYSTDQVVVGKLAWAAEEGQLSVFPLPADLGWIRHFSAKYLAEFLAELLAVLPQAQRTGEWSAVDHMLESWKATANIEADPAVAETVDQGLSELQEGRGTSWSALKAELDL